VPEGADPAAEGAEVRRGIHARSDSREGPPPLVRRKAVCGPGDDGAPCITVMRPDEN
jgi:hypothetical protein